MSLTEPTTALVRGAPIMPDVSLQTGFVYSGLTVPELCAAVGAADLPGVALTGASNVGGTWQVSTDSGTTWSDTRYSSERAALLLTANATTRVRFLPAVGFRSSGTASRATAQHPVSALVADADTLFYYNFSDPSGSTSVVRDKSARGWNAAPAGTATYPASVAPKFSRNAWTSANNLGWLAVNTSASKPVTSTTTGITFAAYIYLASGTSTALQRTLFRLQAPGSTTTALVLEVTIVNSSDYLHFRWYDNGIASSLAQSGVSLPRDRWVHVAGSWSSKNGMRTYVDGVVNGGDAGPGAQGLTFLRDGGALLLATNFPHPVDAVTAWHRELTPTEVYTLVSATIEPAAAVTSDIEPALTLRGWDGATGTAGLQVPVVVDVSGGTAAAPGFTSGTALFTQAVTTNGTVARSRLPTTAPRALATGQPCATVTGVDMLARIGSATGSDVTTATGVVLTGASVRGGTWQVSSDSGTTWSSLRLPFMRGACVLPATAAARLRFAPDGGTLTDSTADAEGATASLLPLLPVSDDSATLTFMSASLASGKAVWDVGRRGWHGTMPVDMSGSVLDGRPTLYKAVASTTVMEVATGVNKYTATPTGLTMACWFYMPSTASWNGNTTYVRVQDSTGSNWLSLQQYDNRFSVQGPGLLRTYNGLGAGQWYHLAASFGPTGSNVYLNGAEVASNYSSGSPATTFNWFSAGTGRILVGSYFVGHLDGVFVAARPYSATEIAALYKASTFVAAVAASTTPIAEPAVEVRAYGGTIPANFVTTPVDVSSGGSLLSPRVNVTAPVSVSGYGAVLPIGFSGPLRALAATQPATTVAALLSAASTSGMATSGMAGLAVLGTNAAGGGVWQYSLDGAAPGGAWTTVDDALPNDALLLPNAAGLRFTPVQGFASVRGTPYSDPSPFLAALVSDPDTLALYTFTQSALGSTLTDIGPRGWHVPLNSTTGAALTTVAGRRGFTSSGAGAWGRRTQTGGANPVTGTIAAWTFAAWVCLPADGAALPSAMVVSLNSTALVSGAVMGIGCSSSGNPFMSNGINSGSNTSGPVMTRGVWTHVAAIMNSVGMLLYTNGVQTGISGYPIGPYAYADTGVLSVGYDGAAASATTSNVFRGSMDHVLVMKRALTATEIASLYASTQPPVTLALPLTQLPGSDPSLLVRPWDGITGAAGARGNALAPDGTIFATGAAAVVRTTVGPDPAALVRMDTARVPQVTVTDVLARFATLKGVSTDGAAGIAVTGASLLGGAWQSSADGGTTWSTVDYARPKAALLLGRTQQLRYQPRNSSLRTAPSAGTAVVAPYVHLFSDPSGLLFYNFEDASGAPVTDKGPRGWHATGGGSVGIVGGRRAWSFTGATNSYLNVNMAPSPVTGTFTNFTMACWLYVPTTGTLPTGYVHPFVYGNTANSKWGGLMFSATYGCLFYNGASQQIPSTWFPIKRGTWTHLVMSHDYSGAHTRLYQDGVLFYDWAATPGTDTLLNDVGGCVRLGCNVTTPTAGGMFVGSLAAPLFLRRAMSPAEVATLYAETAGVVKGIEAPYTTTSHPEPTLVASLWDGSVGVSGERFDITGSGSSAFTEEVGVTGTVEPMTVPAGANAVMPAGAAQQYIRLPLQVEDAQVTPSYSTEGLMSLLQQQYVGVDATAVGGLAIMAATTVGGAWQYTDATGTWQTMDTEERSALLLPRSSSALVRFVSVADAFSSGIASTAVNMAPALAAYTTDSDTLLLYRFNEAYPAGGIRDYGPRGWDATPPSGGGTVTTMAGRRCFAFTNAASTINVNFEGGLGRLRSAPTGLTISFWLYTTGDGTSYMSYTGTDGSLAVTHSGSVFFQVNGGSAIAAVGGWGAQWAHCVFTYGPAGTFHYRNGVSIGTAANTSSSPLRGLMVGGGAASLKFGASFYSTFYMDDILMLGRQASSSEVATLYAGLAGVTTGTTAPRDPAFSFRAWSGLTYAAYERADVRTPDGTVFSTESAFTTVNVVAVNDTPTIVGGASLATYTSPLSPWEGVPMPTVVLGTGTADKDSLVLGGLVATDTTTSTALGRWQTTALDATTGALTWIDLSGANGVVTPLGTSILYPAASTPWSSGTYTAKLLCGVYTGMIAYFNYERAAAANNSVEGLFSTMDFYNSLPSTVDVSGGPRPGMGAMTTMGGSMNMSSTTMAFAYGRKPSVSVATWLRVAPLASGVTTPPTQEMALYYQYTNGNHMGVTVEAGTTTGNTMRQYLKIYDNRLSRRPDYAGFDLSGYVNTWLHLTFTARDDGLVCMYVNGTLQDSVYTVHFQSTDLCVTNGSLLLAGHRTNGLPFFRGAFAETRVYNRELSAAEVAVCASLNPAGTTPLLMHVPRLRFLAIPSNPRASAYLTVRAWDGSDGGVHAKPQVFDNSSVTIANYNFASSTTTSWRLSSTGISNYYPSWDNAWAISMNAGAWVEQDITAPAGLYTLSFRVRADSTDSALTVFADGVLVGFVTASAFTWSVPYVMDIQFSGGAAQKTLRFSNTGNNTIQFATVLLRKATPAISATTAVLSIALPNFTPVMPSDTVVTRSYSAGGPVVLNIGADVIAPLLSGAWKEYNSADPLGVVWRDFGDQVGTTTYTAAGTTTLYDALSSASMLPTPVTSDSVLRYYPPYGWSGVVKARFHGTDMVGLTNGTLTASTTTLTANIGVLQLTVAQSGAASPPGFTHPTATLTSYSAATDVSGYSIMRLAGELGLDPGAGSTVGTTGAWSPLTASAPLTAWFDAADVASLADTTYGANVSVWRDKSPLAMDFGAVGTAPTVCLGMLGNRLPSVSFRGSHAMRTPNRPVARSTTWAFVASSIILAVYPDAGTGTQTLLSCNNTSSINYTFNIENGRTNVYFALGSDGSVYDASVNFNEGAPHVCVITRDDTTGVVQLRIDGQLISQRFDAPTNVNVNVPPFIVLGAQGTDGTQTTLTNFLKGEFGEVLMFGGVLAATDVQELEGYLAHKWDVRMPADHPRRFPATLSAGVVVSGTATGGLPGAWQASTDAGASWAPLLPNTHLRLTPRNRVRFALTQGGSVAQRSGAQPSLTLRAWNGSNGVADGATAAQTTVVAAAGARTLLLGGTLGNADGNTPALDSEQYSRSTSTGNAGVWARDATDRTLDTIRPLPGRTAIGLSSFVGPISFRNGLLLPVVIPSGTSLVFTYTVSATAAARCLAVVSVAGVPLQGTTEVVHVGTAGRAANMRRRTLVAPLSPACAGQRVEVAFTQRGWSLAVSATSGSIYFGDVELYMCATAACIGSGADAGAYSLAAATVALNPALPAPALTGGALTTSEALEWSAPGGVAVDDLLSAAPGVDAASVGVAITDASGGAAGTWEWSSTNVFVDGSGRTGVALENFNYAATNNGARPYSVTDATYFGPGSGGTGNSSLATVGNCVDTPLVVANAAWNAKTRACTSFRNNVNLSFSANANGYVYLVLDLGAPYALNTLYIWSTTSNATTQMRLSVANPPGATDYAGTGDARLQYAATATWQDVVFDASMNVMGSEEGANGRAVFPPVCARYVRVGVRSSTNSGVNLQRIAMFFEPSELTVAQGVAVATSAPGWLPFPSGLTPDGPLLLRSGDRARSRIRFRSTTTGATGTLALRAWDGTGTTVGSAPTFGQLPQVYSGGALLGAVNRVQFAVHQAPLYMSNQATTYCPWRLWTAIAPYQVSTYLPDKVIDVDSGTNSNTAGGRRIVDYGAFVFRFWFTAPVTGTHCFGTYGNYVLRLTVGERVSVGGSGFQNLAVALTAGQTVSVVLAGTQQSVPTVRLRYALNLAVAARTTEANYSVNIPGLRFAPEWFPAAGSATGPFSATTLTASAIVRGVEADRPALTAGAAPALATDTPLLVSTLLTTLSYTVAANRASAVGGVAVRALTTGTLAGGAAWESALDGSGGSATWTALSVGAHVPVTAYVRMRGPAGGVAVINRTASLALHGWDGSNGVAAGATAAVDAAASNAYTRAAAALVAFAAPVVLDTSIRGVDVSGADFVLAGGLTAQSDASGFLVDDLLTAAGFAPASGVAGIAVIGAVRVDWDARVNPADPEAGWAMAAVAPSASNAWMLPRAALLRASLVGGATAGIAQLVYLPVRADAIVAAGGAGQQVDPSTLPFAALGTVARTLSVVVAKGPAAVAPNAAAPVVGGTFSFGTSSNAIVSASAATVIDALQVTDSVAPVDTSASTTIATTADATAGVANPFPLAPTFWFDASDVTTLSTDVSGTGVVSANGSSVALWRDKATGRRHLSNATGTGLPTFVSASPLAGLPALRFSAANALWNRTFRQSFDSSITLFVVFQASTSTTSNSGLVALRSATSGLDTTGPGALTLLTSRVAWVANADQAVYSGAIPGRGVLRVRLSNLTNNLEFGGTTGIGNYTTTGTSGGAMNYTMGQASEMAVGARWATATATQPASSFLDGWIGEVVGFAAHLTAAQCEYVEGLLAYKWGASALLPSTHAFRFREPVRLAGPLAQAPAPFPTPLGLWLDCREPTGTGVALPANAAVMPSWADKGPLFTAAVVPTARVGPNYYTTSGVGSQACMRFNGTTNALQARIEVGQLGTSGDVTLAVAFTTTTATAMGVRNWYDAPALLTTRTLSVEGAQVGLAILGGRVVGGAVSAQNTGSVTVGLSDANPRVTDGLMHIAVLTRSGRTGAVSLFVDGLLVGGGTGLPGSLAVPTLVGIGADVATYAATSTTGPTHFTGDLFEVIVAGGVPTAENRQNMEAYLAYKFGSNARLPSTHPAALAQPVASLALAAPTTVLARRTASAPPAYGIGALRLWLDASDPSGFRYQDASAGILGAWADKGPAGLIASADSVLGVKVVSAPEFGGRNVVRLEAGRSALAIPIPVATLNFATGATLVALVIPRVGFAYGGAAVLTTGGGGTTGPYINVSSGGSGAYTTWGYGNSAGNDAIQGPPAVVDQPMLLVVQAGDSPGTVQLIANGVEYAVTTGATAFDTGLFLYLGRGDNTGVQRFTGDYAEVAVFDRVLTRDERQALEANMVAKWGVPGLLPRGHPYARPSGLPSFASLPPASNGAPVAWAKADAATMVADMMMPAYAVSMLTTNAATRPTGTNLVTNGTFTGYITPTAATNTAVNWSDATRWLGWGWSGTGGVAEAGSGYTPQGLVGGAVWAEQAAGRFSGFFMSSSDSAMEQRIEGLVPGSPYVLSFLHGSSNAYGTRKPAYMRVSFNGTTFATYDVTVPGWTLRVLSFVAPSASVILRFEGYMAGSVNTLSVADVQLVAGVAASATPYSSPASVAGGASAVLGWWDSASTTQLVPANVLPTGTNCITNGTFEGLVTSDTTVASTTSTSSTAVSAYGWGWGGSGLLVSSATYRPALGGAGLPGGAPSWFAGIQQAGSFLQQTVTGLTPGATMTLSFYMAWRYTNPVPGSLLVSVNGVPSAVYTMPGYLWGQRVLVLTVPSSGTLALRFTNVSNDNGTATILMDNFALVAGAPTLATPMLLQRTAGAGMPAVRTAANLLPLGVPAAGGATSAVLLRAAPSGPWRLMTARASAVGGTTTVRLNGATATAAGAASFLLAANSSAGALATAAGVLSAPTQDVDVLESLTFGAALSDADVAALEGYVAWRNFQESVLAAGHPHALAAPAANADAVSPEGLLMWLGPTEMAVVNRAPAAAAMPLSYVFADQGTLVVTGTATPAFLPAPRRGYPVSLTPVAGALARAPIPSGLIMPECTFATFLRPNTNGGQSWFFGVDSGMRLTTNGASWYLTWPNASVVWYAGANASTVRSGMVHVAVVVKPRSATFYMNGQRVQTNYAAYIGLAGSALGLACYDPSTSTFNDMRVYARALTDAEVGTLAAGAAPSFAVAPPQATVADPDLTVGRVLSLTTNAAGTAIQDASGYGVIVVGAPAVPMYKLPKALARPGANPTGAVLDLTAAQTSIVISPAGTSTWTVPADGTAITPALWAADLRAWYDASDVSSMTFVEGTTDRVLRWTDKSGKWSTPAFALADASGGTTPGLLRTTSAALGGASVLRFTGGIGSTMTANNSTPSTTAPGTTVYAVHVPSKVSAASTVAIAATGQLSSATSLSLLDGQLAIDTNQSPQRTGITAVNSMPYIHGGVFGGHNNWRCTSHVNGVMGLTQTQWRNGVNDYSNYGNGGIPTSHLWFGKNTAAGANFYSGDLAELIVINKNIGAAERAMLEGYLAWKWGLTASLPLEHPFRTRAPTFPLPPLMMALPAKVPVLPAALAALSAGDAVLPTVFTADLVAWYDANDAATRTPISVGSAFTKAWANKAPSGGSMASDNLTTGVQFVDVSGRTMARFTGVSPSAFTGTHTTMAPGPGVTLMAVHVPRGGSTVVTTNGGVGNRTSPRLFLSGPDLTPGTYLAADARQSAIPLTDSINVTAAPTSNLHVCTYSTETGMTATLNGGPALWTDTREFTGLNASLDMFLGKGTATSEYFRGDLGEVLVFKRALQEGERQLMEGYLAWKWGLVASLAPGHPYRSTSPVAPLPMSVLAPTRAAGPVPIAAVSAGTFAAWLYITALPESGFHYIMARIPAANLINSNVALLFNSTTLRYQWNSTYYDTNLTLTRDWLNRWMHLAVTVTNGMQVVYVNGIRAVAPTTNAHAAPVPWGAYCSVGGNGNDVGAPNVVGLRGYFDAVTMYTRALSASDVLSLAYGPGTVATAVRAASAISTAVDGQSVAFNSTGPRLWLPLTNAVLWDAGSAFASSTATYTPYTLAGGATLAQSLIKTPVGGFALDMTASGGYALAPSRSLFITPSTLTVAFWARLSAQSWATPLTLAAARFVHANGTAYTYSLGVDVSGGKPALRYTWANTAYSLSSTGNAGALLDDVVGTWAHFALVITPFQASVYINGLWRAGRTGAGMTIAPDAFAVGYGSTSLHGPPTYTTQAFPLDWRIASDGVSAATGVRGYYSDFRVYTRALAAGEVLSVATGGKDTSSAAAVLNEATTSAAASTGVLTTDAPGIAIIAANTGGGGSWQASTDGGNTWTTLNGVSAAKALHLTPAATNMMRFVRSTSAATNASLTVRAWDQSNRVPNGSLWDARTGGGRTAYSTDLRVLPITLTGPPGAVRITGASVVPAVVGVSDKLLRISWSPPSSTIGLNNYVVGMYDAEGALLAATTTEASVTTYDFPLVGAAATKSLFNLRAKATGDAGDGREDSFVFTAALTDSASIATALSATIAASTAAAVAAAVSSSLETPTATLITTINDLTVEVHVASVASDASGTLTQSFAVESASASSVGVSLPAGSDVTGMALGVVEDSGTGSVTLMVKAFSIDPATGVVTMRENSPFSIVYAVPKSISPAGKLGVNTVVRKTLAGEVVETVTGVFVSETELDATFSFSFSGNSLLSIVFDAAEPPPAFAVVNPDTGESTGGPPQEGDYVYSNPRTILMKASGPMLLLSVNEIRMFFA